MSISWVRGALIATMVTAAACGRSPTAPETPPPSAVLGQGDTATIPGTDLRVTVTGLATAASIDCLANAPCNLTPTAFLELKVPSAGAERVLVRLPNDGGGDRASYGGYVVRVPSLRWMAGSAGSFALTITATRE
jgi:hypothetical protein